MGAVDEGMTVGACADLLGVSVRTLHHWDEVGLARPSSRTAAGYRCYHDADVARLHRVLVYRELGLPLEEIATLLDDPTVDAVAHLRRQRELLLGRADRLHRMVAAVDRMMEAEMSGEQLSAAERAEVFGDDWLGEEYAAEAEQRWGETDAWRQSQERTASFGVDDWRAVKAETDALEADFAAALADGVAPGSASADALAARHRASIERFYDCSPQMHAAVAETYVSDERFRAHYEAVAPGLAQYVRDVVVAATG
ncbi:MerR family transcriptional regulator [Rhodococcus aerolatus]